MVLCVCFGETNPTVSAMFCGPCQGFSGGLFGLAGRWLTAAITEIAQLNFDTLNYRGWKGRVPDFRCNIDDDNNDDDKKQETNYYSRTISRPTASCTAARSASESTESAP